MYAATGGELLTVALQERLTLTISAREDGLIRYAENQGPWGRPTRPRPSECLASAAVTTLHPAGADVRVAAPITPGAGLGGSGAFVVALTAGLLAMIGRRTSRADLMRLALHIERDVYGAPIGAQDVAAASFGAFLRVRVNRQGAITIGRPMALEHAFRELIAPSLLLVDTGLRRSARHVLDDAVLTGRSEVGRRLIEQVHAFERLIKAGDVNGYGRALSSHWEGKRRQSPPTAALPQIDAVYALGIEAGCAGGKLVGAGGGGYFLFAGGREALARLREAATLCILETRPVVPAMGRGVAVHGR